MLELSKKTIMNWSRLGMRKSLGYMLCDLVASDDKIIVLTADLANAGNLQVFAEKYPDKFFNIGIAEQNMTAVASGLAKEGFNVFIVSFAPFVSMRAYEAVRSLVGYMRLRVKIIAMGSGASLGYQGVTHYCFEDISLMRTIPGMEVYSPADCLDEAKCLQYFIQHDGPCYLRLTGSDGVSNVYKNDFDFIAGEPHLLRDGNDILILATGSVVSECIRAVRALKKENFTCAVYNVSTLKPVTFKKINFDDYKLIITVEEHYICGGLGSILAEYLAGYSQHPRLIRIGIPDKFIKAEAYGDVLHNNGLSADILKEKILDSWLGYNE